MYNIPQKLTAEFLGTFALVFFGEGAICADQFLHGAGGLGLLGIAAAHGLAIAVMFAAFGLVPGGRRSFRYWFFCYWFFCHRDGHIPCAPSMPCQRP